MNDYDYEMIGKFIVGLFFYLIITAVVGLIFTMAILGSAFTDYKTILPYMMWIVGSVLFSAIWAISED